jgi:hypothetical protein
MLNSISDAIENLAAADPLLRATAAAEIYRHGRDFAEGATAAWWRDEELARLLLGDERKVTVGVAVRRETFARIRAGNGAPPLASVPPDQDAEEFELHFADGVELDVLTTRDPADQGAIARFLSKFGEGVQQVEFQCTDVDRATELLGERFGVKPIYPSARSGAGSTRINFFLLAISNSARESGKILIELYERSRASD